MNKGLILHEDAFERWYFYTTSILHKDIFAHIVFFLFKTFF